MKLLQPSILIAIGLVHAYVFCIIWAVLGAHADFLVLGPTNSFVASTVSGTIVTTLVVTSPMALFAGWISERRYVIPSMLSFVLGWATLNFWYTRPKDLLSRVVATYLAFDLVTIAIFSVTFFLIGSHLRTARSPNQSSKRTR